MIPKTDINIDNGFIVKEQPSYTFWLHSDKEQIIDFTDGLGAVKQSVELILNTERYNYLIYDWDYGVEFSDLIGEEKHYAMAQIEQRITEALLQDDRIIDVSDFSFISVRNSITARFVVHSIFGTFKKEKAVNI